MQQVLEPPLGPLAAVAAVVFAHGALVDVVAALRAVVPGLDVVGAALANRALGHWCQEAGGALYSGQRVGQTRAGKMSGGVRQCYPLSVLSLVRYRADTFPLATFLGGDNREMREILGNIQGDIRRGPRRYPRRHPRR